MDIKFIKVKKRRNSDWSRGVKKISHQKFVFVFLCFVFLLGIIIGTLYMNKSGINLEENEFTLSKQNIETSKLEIFYRALYENGVIVLLFWIVGLSIVGVPILMFIIFSQGAFLGVSIWYILSIFGRVVGYKFIYAQFYFTTLINLFIMISLCFSAVELTYNVIRKNKDIKSEFIRHSTACILMTVVIFFSSFIEMYLCGLSQKIIL